MVALYKGGEALMYDLLDFSIFSTIIILHSSFMLAPGLYALYLLSLHAAPLSGPVDTCVCVSVCVYVYLSVCPNN